MNRWLSSLPSPPIPAGCVRVLFLDRDGVLLVEKNYLSDPAAVQLVPGAVEALKRARAAGFVLIGISNQSGIGRGLFTMEDFTAVMTRFDEMLHAAGCPLEAFFYCPHAPSEQCSCRKPSPGLLHEAAREVAWDPAGSWVIGDKVSDVELARAAGLRSILVRTGHGREQARRLAEDHDAWVVADLPEAVAMILRQTEP